MFGSDWRQGKRKKGKQGEGPVATPGLLKVSQGETRVGTLHPPGEIPSRTPGNTTPGLPSGRSNLVPGVRPRVQQASLPRVRPT